MDEGLRDVSLTPYYQDAAATLYHGDCREILPQLAPIFEVTVTDPPYNAGKNYGEATNDRREWPEWCAWFDDVLSLCLPLSRDGVLSFLSQTAYRQYVRLGRHEMAWSAVWIKPLSMAVCAAPFMPHWEPIAYWGDKRRRRGDGEGDASDHRGRCVDGGRDDLADRARQEPRFVAMVHEEREIVALQLSDSIRALKVSDG